MYVYVLQGTLLSKIWDVGNEALRLHDFHGLWRLTVLTSAMAPIPLVSACMLHVNQLNNQLKHSSMLLLVTVKPASPNNATVQYNIVRADHRLCLARAVRLYATVS
jgi:hypothetical protein